MDIEITIQGIRGCFHEAAAIEYFTKHLPHASVKAVPCDTFEEMIERISATPSLLGIMAIENTIAGPLLQNHELLRKSQLTIAGEHKMRISHVLAALSGQKVDEIREVISHPMALMQCAQYLGSHPWMKMTETFDTAGSAAMIASERSTGKGAICSEFAAELYGLEPIAKGIETNKRNFTRFLIIGHHTRLAELHTLEHRPNKSSVVFTLPHEGGALSKVLTILSFYDMNLTKIQSTPLLGKEWEYRFYVDLTFTDYTKYVHAIDAVRPLTSDLRILGEYTECNNTI